MTATQPIVVGTLVRVTNVNSGFVGMTGRIESFDTFMPNVATVRMTATGHDLSFALHELTIVRQPQVSA